MIYGELGVTPISVDIKAKTISFWSKVVSQQDQPTRLSYQMYTTLKTCINLISAIQHSSQILNQFLIYAFFSGIWQSQDVINPRWLSLAIKQK